MPISLRAYLLKPTSERYRYAVRYRLPLLCVVLAHDRTDAFEAVGDYVSRLMPNVDPSYCDDLLCRCIRGPACKFNGGARIIYPLLDWPFEVVLRVRDDEIRDTGAVFLEPIKRRNAVNLERRPPKTADFEKNYWSIYLPHDLAELHIWKDQPACLLKKQTGGCLVLSRS